MPLATYLTPSALRSEHLVIEWFKRLGDVPGVSWQPRASADPHLVGAYPVARERRFEGDADIRWVDSEGQPLADEWSWRDSPVALTTRGYLDAEAEERVTHALGALEVPGTRADFHQALWYARGATERQDRPDFTLLEALLLAHVHLVLADPTGAVGGHERLESAGEPFARLLNLYKREGFLREAAQVERLAMQLPPEARPRYLIEPGPAALIEALRETL